MAGRDNQAELSVTDNLFVKDFKESRHHILENGFLERASKGLNAWVMRR